MKSTFFKVLMLLLLFAGVSFASSAPTDFASAIPSTLIPSGFWQLVGVVFTAVGTIWGITKGIRLFKRA